MEIKDELANLSLPQLWLLNLAAKFNERKSGCRFEMSGDLFCFTMCDRNKICLDFIIAR